MQQLLRVSKNPQTVKMDFLMGFGVLFLKMLQQTMITGAKPIKPLLRKNFDFDRKTNPNVPSVRRRVRFASLWGIEGAVPYENASAGAGLERPTQLK